MKAKQIEARIEELKRQLEQAKANANALGGAIQDCEYWLTVLPKEEENAGIPESAVPPQQG